VVDPAGRYVYVTNRGSNSLAVMALDATTGSLAHIDGSPFALNFEPFGFAIHPSGTFAVASDIDDDGILVLSLDPATGVPSVVSTPLHSGVDPTKVIFDPSGKHVFVANQTSNDVSVFDFDATTGALARVAGEPYASGGRWAYQVAVDPSGTMLFNVNYDSGSVSAYRVAQSGTLSRIAGSPFAAGVEPYGMAVDPSGKHLYVAAGGSGKVYGYAVDVASGSVAALPGSPYDSGATHGMALDPSGSIAIVANFGGDTISTMTVDAATGQLTRRGEWAAGLQPLAVAFVVVK
jgi:6-phosphogluconolactonase